MSTKTKKVTGVANPARAQAMVALRASGAAGRHGDRRDRRARTRQGQRARWRSDQVH